MDHEYVVPPHSDEGADLVFAVLKAAFLVLAEDQIEMLCYAQAIIARAPDCKQAELAIYQHRTLHRTFESLQQAACAPCPCRSIASQPSSGLSAMANSARSSAAIMPSSTRSSKSMM